MLSRFGREPQEQAAPCSLCFPGVPELNRSIASAVAITTSFWRASRALRNHIGFDCFLYKSLALLCSPKVQCRVLFSLPCSRVWLRHGGVYRPDRQMCGNRGDSQCDCLDGKFLVKPLRCNFMSFQCWGLSYASNSRLAVGQCCQCCVISAAFPWSLYLQPVLDPPSALMDWDQQVLLQLCACAVLHKIPALTVLCCVTHVP